MFGRRSEQERETEKSQSPISEDFRQELLSVLAAEDGEVVQEPDHQEGPAYLYVLSDHMSDAASSRQYKDEFDGRVDDEEPDEHAFSHRFEILPQLSVADAARANGAASDVLKGHPFVEDEDSSLFPSSAAGAFLGSDWLELFEERSGKSLDLDDLVGLKGHSVLKEPAQCF